MPDVMAIGMSGRHRAAWVATAFITALHRQAKARRDQPPCAANVDRKPVTLSDGDHVGIATHPPHRRRREPRSVLDPRTSTRERTAKGVLVNVHDNLRGWRNDWDRRISGNPRLTHANEGIRTQHRM